MMNAAAGIFLAARRKGWTNPYVTDGLVAMWDGEWNSVGGQHDANGKYLYDIINDEYADLMTSQFRAGTNYWEVTRASATGKTSSLSTAFLSAIVGGYARIETVLYPNVVATQIYGNNCFSISGGYFGYNEHSGNGGCSIFSSGWVSAKDTALVGVPVGNVALDLDAANNTIKYTVGKVDSAIGSITIPDTIKNGCCMNNVGTRFYSLRIYSRALTAAEIAANYAVDKARFNLP